MLEKFICFLITTIIFASPVLTSYDVSKFINSSSDDELVEKIDRLVRTCFSNTNKLITLSGKVSLKLVESIHKSEFTSVTKASIDSPSFDKLYKIAKQSRRIYNDEFYFRFNHKAQGFILAASSQPILRHQLKELENSRWWKSRGFFMIIDDGTTINNSCKNAQKFLWTAWRYNILSSIFLCRDTSKRLMMYSYNPYNTMAPKNWLKVNQRFGRHGHPWILFKRSTSESLHDCSEVFFEKTKTLDDYKLRINAVPLSPGLSIDSNETGFDKYGGRDGGVMQNILNFLNASIEDVPYTGNDPLGYYDDNGTYFGMLGDVFSGRVDIGMNGRYMVSMWKLAESFPYTSTDLCFVVKSRGNVPQWMSLAFVFDIWISLGLIIVILLTITVLSYYTNISASCLNSLRLVVSASLIKLPAQLPARLFLSNVFFFFLIANGLFQGLFISFITKPRALKNPETQTDLGIAGYKVYGYPPFAKYIDDPILRSNFVSIMQMKCVDRIINGEHVTCILDCHGSYIHPKNFTDFHIVSQRLQTFYVIFATSMDWPLLERFNQLVQRLAEAGFPDYWMDREKQTGNKSVERNHSPYLSLADLAFIFYGLLLGLIFSTLVFFYELVYGAWYEIRFRKNPAF